MFTSTFQEAALSFSFFANKAMHRYGKYFSLLTFRSPKCIFLLVFSTVGVWMF